MYYRRNLECFRCGKNGFYHPLSKRYREQHDVCSTHAFSCNNPSCVKYKKNNNCKNEITKPNKSSKINYDILNKLIAEGKLDQIDKPYK